jgi:ABC-type multidrug transport system fused ATPase/permease subunit
MKNTKKVLSIIWIEMKKYRWYALVTVILFGGMIVIGDAIVPLYIKKIIDVLGVGEFTSAFSLMWILIGAYFLQRILLFCSMHTLSYFQSLLARDLYASSFDYFTSHSYNFYANEFMGSLVEKSKRLGSNVIGIIDTMLFNFFSITVSVISILVLLFIENVTMGFIFLGFLLIYSLLVRWMSKKMAPPYRERSLSKTAVNSTLSDILTNMQTVLFFSSHANERDTFKKSNQNFHKKRYRAWRAAINYHETLGFLPSLFTSGVTMYAVYLASIGSMSTGSVVLIFLLGNNFGDQIWRINHAVKDFVSMISDCIESIEIIEQEPSVQDVPNPTTFIPKSGEINFKNISFTYPEGDHVFNNFTLKIPHQQSIGIVGKSGSGKTTITKLLLRLYDIDSGEITFDGSAIGTMRQKYLRKSIAYVPQDTVLFHRTIYENITYGNLHASKEEVLHAAKMAHVDEFVSGFNDGYKTMVGERGVKLSGGQRQRIGIARAMLKKDAPVLVMDEATSSLDTISEQYIQESFASLSQGRTTIVIAHRLSTIQKMDRILVLDKGNIVEDGSHKELLIINGHYAQLWNSQIDELIT